MKALTSILFGLVAVVSAAEQINVYSPDRRLHVTLSDEGGRATYMVSYDGATVLETSRLGFVADCGDFSEGLKIKGVQHSEFEDSYSVPTIKKSHVDVKANRTKVDYGKFAVLFHVSNNDVAFRYEVPVQGKGTRCIRMLDEKTSFSFPADTKGFLTPQSAPMVGWKRTKPSYEEEYVLDAKLPVKSKYGRGWTFPALFCKGNHWVLLGETGTDSRYCGCRLGEFDGCSVKVEFPMAEENNGNGTREPAFALPGATPWRTITVGNSLAPVVETTIAWDVVKPKYDAKPYRYGRSTWSWILWDDASMNWRDQTAYIDFAAAMGYEFILIDAGWDTAKDIGHERMPELVKYAESKGVGVFLWYSSSGWWNDIVQSPIDTMDDPIRRKAEMRWMKSLGVKGIKVDFWGGDKQETFRLYEQVLSDADDNDIMVIFHGCTIPRGWERMYPNYVGSEAVLASENRRFSKHFCDEAGKNASIHPFIRNALGAMEYGGTFLNERMHRDNKGGHARGTTVDFELATAILFQNPVQNFALAPNNLKDAPQYAIDFMTAVPTTWDETRFIDGYPGIFAFVARRSGKTWYVAGVASVDVSYDLDLTPFGGIREHVSIKRNDGIWRVIDTATSPASP